MKRSSSFSYALLSAVTLDRPPGICTTTFTNPPIQEQHFSTKKLPLGKQLVQIKAHVTMHSIPRHFQISITFSYCFIKNTSFIEWLCNIKGWKSQIPCHAQVCPKGQSPRSITGMAAERCIFYNSNVTLCISEIEASLSVNTGPLL